jgi:outer membrane immunogenic protein
MVQRFSENDRALGAVTFSRCLPAAASLLPARLLLESLALGSLALCCAGPAHAQSAASVYNWTGFYAGINVGVGGGVASPVLDVSSPLEPGFFGSSSTDHQNHRLGGAFLGGQAGYNYQFRNNVVVGVESDLQWSNIRALLHDDNTFDVTDGFLLSSVATSETKISQNWFGTTRLRLGYTFADRFLAYVTGGVAYSGFNVSNSGIGTELSPPLGGPFSLTAGSAASTRFGWTAGTGAEYALNNRLSLKSEYLYSQYSGFTAPYLNNALSTPAVTAGTYSSGTLGIHLLRAELNYKLGDSGEIADMQPSGLKLNWTPDWNGFYAGVNGGYGAGVATPRLSETTLRQIQPFGGGGASTENFISDDRGTLRSAGFLAGGQFGYNRRLPNKFVVGVETDLQWSGIRASNQSNVSGINIFPPDDGPAFAESSSTSQISIRQNWFGTTRLRLGYRAFDRVLAYATGGIAYAGFSADTSAASNAVNFFDTEHGSTSGSGSSTRIGWTVGAGVEYAIAENLSFKSEYLYSQYSGFDFPYQRSFVVDALVTDTTQGTLSTGTLGIHLVRAGLNWKLGDPGH